MKPIIPFLLLLFTFSCQENKESAPNGDYLTIQGETMGTYYRILFAAEGQPIGQGQIDSLLRAINLEVSTYIDSATISRFNRAETFLVLKDRPDKEGGGNMHFRANYHLAKKVYEVTGGAFDPTVMPLVNYWGFGYTEKRKVMAVDRVKVDSLIRLVGFDQVTLRPGPPDTLFKSLPGVQLDFSACAKGYAVDALGQFLGKNGIQNYLVDIGGEARARGVNAQGNIWTIGINTPKEEASVSEIIMAMPLQNQAVATSGNYRNFYEVGGSKYSHTINPKTGFPERSNLLSASVFTTECMVADAYATAFMVMGLEKAFAMAKQLPDLEAYFIYSDESGLLNVAYTEGLKSILEN